MRLAHPQPLVDIPGAEVSLRDARTVSVDFPRRGARPVDVINLVADRYEVSDLSLEEPSLEDVLQKLYAQKVEPLAAAR